VIAYLQSSRSFQQDSRLANPGPTLYLHAMSFTEVLQELPALTVEQRQLLIRRALELDDRALSAEDEALVQQRLADHCKNPDSAVPLDEMKARLRSRRPK